MGTGDQRRHNSVKRSGNGEATPSRSVAQGAFLLFDRPAHSSEACRGVANADAQSGIPNDETNVGTSIEDRIKGSDLSPSMSPEERWPGTSSADKGSCMEHASGKFHALETMRPSEIVRLVNSAGFGSVIGDRQLYRHRQQCPAIESSSKRVSLVAYTAWLIEHRHRRASEKGRRRIGGSFVDLGVLTELLKHQEFRCAITGDPITPTNFALDHNCPTGQRWRFLGQQLSDCYEVGE